MPKQQTGVLPYLVNLALVAVLFLPRILPYRWRIPLVGWLSARVVAPIAGYDRRVRDNLALVCPEIDDAEARRIARGVADNAGRMFAEMYAGSAFVERVRRMVPKGPGLAALDAARAAGRPVIALSGHIGNYNACRVAMAQRGHVVGALYRPLANVYFNAHYVRAMEALAAPLFAQDRRGMVEMIRHLKAGNAIALLTDQRDNDGAVLQFFGQPALTALSAAELALKHDALLLPGFGIRREDGLDFDIWVDAPIPHTTPEEMMQVYNDRLEAHVRAHMDQWLWVHRRWKFPKKRKAGKGKSGSQ